MRHVIAWSSVAVLTSFAPSAWAQSWRPPPAASATPPGAPPPSGPGAPAAQPEPPPPPPPPPGPDPNTLGGPGESCRARADCRPGLACIEAECRDEREGTTCAASTDCGGELRCIDNECVNPLTMGSKKKKKKGGRDDEDEDEDGESSAEKWLSFELEGAHPFVGMTWLGGPAYILDPIDDVSGTFFFALRGGVMLDKLELGIEFSPMTALYEGTTHLQFNGFVGYYIPIADNIYWPIRGGVGMVAVDLPADRVWLQVRADLVGVAFQVGHVIIDLNLPSFRFTTDIEDIHAMAWLPGGSVSYVF
jgi:hypothetical protein